MKLALVTQNNLPDWESDDAPLVAELQSRGHQLTFPVWDDRQVNWNQLDAALIRTTWDYMNKHDAFLAWVEQVGQATRLFNGPDVVRWNLDKRYLQELETHGVAIPPTVWLPQGKPTDIRALMGQHGWHRGFIKPVVGACAWETLRFQADDAGLTAAQAHLERMLAAGHMMLQPYLAQVETRGECSVLFFGGRLSHGVRKVPVPGDYRVQDDFGAHDEPYALSEAEEAWAMQVIEVAQQILGQPLLYARVDMLWGDGGELYLTELELIEPSLFFRHGPQGPGLLVDALEHAVKAAC